MAPMPREDWSRHIDQVLRSKHYTWIAEGLAGAPLREALTTITADLMHLCHRSGLSWEQLLAESSDLCATEESQGRTTAHAA